MSFIKKRTSYIFLIHSLRPGGAEKNCIKLANEFVKRDNDVSIWLREFHQNDLRSNLSKDISVVALGGRGFISTSYYVVKKIFKTNPDSFLVFNYFLFAPVVFVKLLFKKQYKINYRIMSSLPLQMKEQKSLYKKLLGTFILKRLVPFSDSIIAQCEGMKNEASNFISIPSTRITTIYNPVSDFEYSSTPEKKHEILFIGRLIPLKGLFYLIDAFEILSKKDFKVTLLILGDGPMRASIQEKISYLNLEGRIILEGFKENPSHYYLQAKATVLTSLYEGFPNVLIESICLGTPIVAFDCKTGPSEIIIEGVNGYLVPYLDVNKLAEKLFKILHSDSFQTSTVIETGKKFDLNLIARSYIELCRPD